jgi:hypothetical protein
MEPSRAGAPPLQLLTDGHRPAAGGASLHTWGRRDNKSKQEQRKKWRNEWRSTPRTWRSASGGHRRPASRPPPAPAPPATPTGVLHRAPKGGLRVRGNPNRTPLPSFLFSGDGPAGLTRPRRAINRPAGPHTEDSGPQAA